MKKMIALMSAFCLMLTMLMGTVTVSAETENAGGYQVQVTDADGSPVSGVMVQFCSDSECMMGKTDDSGMAQFDQPAGSYSIHILKVPEGFLADSSEYAAPETPGLTTVTILRETDMDAEADEDADEEDVMDSPKLGFHFEMPEAYKHLKGTLTWDASFAAPGVIEIIAMYFAIPEDQMDSYYQYMEEYVNAYVNGEEIPESPDPSWMNGNEYGMIFNIYAINDGRGEEELREVTKETTSFGDDYAWIEEIGKYGDTTFYLAQFSALEENKENYKAAMGDYYDEFVSLYSDKDTFLSALTTREPEWPKDLTVGSEISFETTDLDGNPVSSKDLFADRKVTMINLWATWCGPCKAELPDLAQMAEQFAAKDCQIIGVCHDGAEEGKAEAAKAILEEAGVNYLNIVGPENVDEVFNNTAFPTTYFVDSEGKLLIEPVVGMDLEGYPEALEEALALVE